MCRPAPTVHRRVTPARKRRAAIAWHPRPKADPPTFPWDSPHPRVSGVPGRVRNWTHLLSPPPFPVPFPPNAEVREKETSGGAMALAAVGGLPSDGVAAPAAAVL